LRAEGEAIYPFPPDADQAAQAVKTGCLMIDVMIEAGIERTCPANRDSAAAPGLPAVARSATGITENHLQRARTALQ
jgi:hypothetical protein